MKTMIIIVYLLCYLPFSAISNDGIAGYKAGKIELNFKSKTNVSMKSEILKISQSKVDVDYVFYNDSKKDEEVLIAFPFPEIDCSDFRFDLDNKFVAFVNGEPVTLNEEIRIESKGKDITDEVKKIGLKLCRDSDVESEMIANVKMNITNPEKYKFKDTCNELLFYSYSALDPKNKESLQGLIKRFRTYTAKYNKSKNLPQAFSMLDHLEHGIE